MVSLRIATVDLVFSEVGMGGFILCCRKASKKIMNSGVGGFGGLGPCSEKVWRSLAVLVLQGIMWHCTICLGDYYKREFGALMERHRLTPYSRLDGSDRVWVEAENYQSSKYLVYKLQMRALSPLCWLETGDRQLTRLDIIQETVDKIMVIKEQLKTARSRQKSYADNRRKPLEFQVGDQVLLKVSLWKGTIRFEKRGKLNPSSGIHNVFHVLNLKKCLTDETLVVPLKELKITDKLQFIEEPLEIIDRDVKRLKQSRIPIVKVGGISRTGFESSRGERSKTRIKRKYPHLFSSAQSSAETR
ncbi:hypothetical protein Tco_0792004 [Tanacetum coccineum]